MFFLSFIEACIKRLPTDDDLPVYFLIDEFGNTFIPNFSNIITTTRKFKISFVLMMQSIEQITQNYGKTGAHEILSGITTHVCFGAAEDSSSEFFSNKVGKKRRYYRNEEQNEHIEHVKDFDLISRSEIRELRDNQVLLVSENKRATKLDVYPYYLSWKWRDMTKIPPATIQSRPSDKIAFIPL
jgi:type IV secretory pathway TraG/TraD family ATPase VirD4